MEPGSTIYRAAERRLLDAIRAGVACDFADGAAIPADEMASWGPERTVRATLLHRLLTADDVQYAKHGIQLRGAAVEGVLDLGGLTVMPLELQQCRIATVEASGAMFAGDARFGGATFTGDAQFTDATFMGTTQFSGSTFARLAGFGRATFTGDAQFSDATFVRHAEFSGTTFTGDAWFSDATFPGLVSFDLATFVGYAGFHDTTFTAGARFNLTTFVDRSGFHDATFTGDASFDGATFTGNASFPRATFTGDAQFMDTTFTGDAYFGGAIADHYNFRRAQFHTTDPGPWIARKVTLAGAVFHVPARVAVAAVAESDCRRLQAREGVHLLVRGGAVALEDAEFLRRSILAHSESEPAPPKPDNLQKRQRPEGFDDLTPARQAQWTAGAAAVQLAQTLVDWLGPQHSAKPADVVSLRRAITGDLVLSGVGLDGCAFAGAHGLDKLRIDATCSFQRPPAWPQTWRPFTGRRLISEEAQWRHTHTRGWAVSAIPPPDTPGAFPPWGPRFPTAPDATPKLPTALEIAGIYRDLRKGLEDAKDEPGAADFYYGEMEMRRLASRGSRHQRNFGGGPKGRLPSWTERRLLDAYWALSGYGLRAWRAVTALTILLIGCAALFTMPVFAHLPAVPQHVSSVNLQTGMLRYAPGAQPGGKPDASAAVTFGTSLKFTSTESLTLIRASGTPLLETTGAGTVVDIALRLLAPLLLGLAVLAVRGRTKR